MTGRAAVFLDRDGTVTEPRHYPARPADLVLAPGVGPALRRLQRQGWSLVLVTNQSGLARGLFSLRTLDAMHRYLRTLLTSHGVRLDGIYVCPHHPDGAVDGLSFRCACRKPNAGLLVVAAEELDLDLASSWMVGDFASDIDAGRRAGCRTAWVGPAATTGTRPPGTEPTLRTATVAEALHHIARLRS
ncbi:D-glycero-alpha-D-manno-heptose-1,7-bisphosphate 7-phosphatase [Streptomyces coeruleorubidus]|uniref:D-glycero-alpha-D-manno-heptose-1,7-bisphosphate 7-phosphatase n=1 Tax=Streptomyces coeruleorubidus TaxID=116188 RepID=UPI0037F959E6